MKKDSKKDERSVAPEQEAESAVNGEVDEQREDCSAQTELGIDRDSMSDEEYISALELKLGESLARESECKTLAQRIQADFDNYRKRNNALADEMRQIGQSVVIEKLLTVLDNCDLARKYIRDEASLTGFNMMEAQILTALSGFGLMEIEADDKVFDAKLMNAVEREKNEQKQGKVTEVLQKGYTLSGKLLRPASVKVGYWDAQTPTSSDKNE